MQKEDHIHYMRRCLDLAAKGAGYVAPNPMVGAVLVYDGTIIGEGLHEKYGEAHAEVNCIRQALVNAPEKIKKSTLYVSLEPCAHFGKTPPCADLIVHYQIPRVVVACRDPFKQVDGKGIERLRANGVEVIEKILEKNAILLNKRFFTFHTKKRPYIILKWAQTANRFIAGTTNERLRISHDITNRLVHKWRSEEAGIMVGANTIRKDNPQLDNRYWRGNNPVKIIVSASGELNSSANVFQDEKLLYYTKNTSTVESIIIRDENFLEKIINDLYQRNIQSILVEGGARLLQCFIDKGIWDEARVITNRLITVEDGLQSPVLKKQHIIYTENILDDEIVYYSNIDTN